MAAEQSFTWNFQFRVLKWILILSGALLMSAYLTAFLSVAAMRNTHQWLGLGEFPVAPITEYLARSTSLLYGVHGTVMFFTGVTLQHHWRYVPLLGGLHIVIGTAVLIIDITAGMPTYWTLIEGGPVAVLGVLILLLYRQGRSNWSFSAP